MKKDDVLEHFGTLEKVAATLGISVSAVSQWGEIMPYSLY
ncbi:Cro/CI family transcriptional regulator [Mannheimia sp. E30BD]